MTASETTYVQFVCMRPAHHRHRMSALSLCEHQGCAAYCPAGDVGDHDWLPVLTRTASLVSLGYAPARADVPAMGEEREAEGDLVLIR